MASSNSKRRTVKLDYVQQNNIVEIDLNRSPVESVFEKEYQKAAKIIKNIIAESREKTNLEIHRCRACKSRNCKSCRYRDHSGYEDSDISRYNRTEFQTAVPFIGDRGTGKSSVMCSVLKTLSCYNGRTGSNMFDLGKENEHSKFITFEMIDANTLKPSESIMEIILSRMLSYLEDIQPEYDFRELYRQIDELHKDLGLVYWKNARKPEGYGLAALQRVADSQKTINRFQELVKQFTRDISAYRFSGDPCYLVVALDDIDMYRGASNRGSQEQDTCYDIQDTQFDLLEHIYNHLRTPGLIVLMTYNEHILRRKCNDHFARIYCINQNQEAYSKATREDIEGLTAQFMSKLFPQERRIYLPNYMFVNSENRSNLYVKPALDEEDDMTESELTTLFGGTEELPVKEFMLRLIAYKTDVYFDAAGTKKHFFEPRNLRELGELFRVIYALEKIPAEANEEEQAQVRDRNRQELLDYLYQQFALGHLNSEEYRRFSELSTLPLDRQNRMLTEQIRRHRSKNVTLDEEAHLSLTKYDRWQFSYGELLYNIYWSTRLPKKLDSEETLFSKEFMHCILGTRSVIMNQSVHGLNAHKAMLSMMGSSLAGRWANNMLPDFKSDKFGLSPTPAASISMPLRHFFDWQIPVEVQDAILYHRTKKSSKELSKYLEALIFIGMFFTSFPVNGFKIALELDIDDNKQATICLRSSSEDHICFNVMNFAINLYDALTPETGYLSIMRDKLIKLGKDFPNQLERNFEREIIDAEEKKQEREHPLELKKPLLRIEDFAVPSMAERQRTIDIASAWLQLTYGNQFDYKKFIRMWEKHVTEVCTKIEMSIKEWQNTYTHFPMVLPVQHFDMMYNIIKRLASVYYHDIPDEASIEEIYDYYARLYESIAQELEVQDQVYRNMGTESFAQAFRESVFYKTFVSKKKEPQNPYIKIILVEMMKNALVMQNSYMNHVRIPELRL